MDMHHHHHHHHRCSKRPFSQQPPLSSSSSSSSSSIEDLQDDLLLEIFSRLPRGTVFSIKCVCKSWHSLLSDPDATFVVRFLNHERETGRTTTDYHKWGFILHPKDGFILHPKDQNLPNERLMCPTIHITSGSDDQRKFASHKLTLGFLPFYKEMKIVATFKDLVLCCTMTSYNRNSKLTATTSSSRSRRRRRSSSSTSMRRVYHICNPFTKKWVTLPSCPLVPNPYPWATLICEDFYQYDYENGITIRGGGLEYRFRVVVAEPLSKQEFSIGPAAFKLTIFCSELGQWKRFRLFVPSPYLRGIGNQVLQGVVCNRMVYLWHGHRFGAFDPFDEATTSSSLGVAPTSLKGKGSNAPKEEEVVWELAIKMVVPEPGTGWSYWKLLECGGRLLSVEVFSLHAGFVSIKELIMTDHEPPTLRWKVRAQMVFDLASLSSSNVTLNNNDNNANCHDIFNFKFVGFHPMNKDYYYLLVTTRDPQGEYTTRLVLWHYQYPRTKKRSRKACFKPLSCSFLDGEANDGLLSLYSSLRRIKLPCWPTPIPTIQSPP